MHVQKMQKDVIPKKDFPNAILFTVPYFHRNTSNGSPVKKKIRSWKHNTSPWARKVNNQSIP